MGECRNNLLCIFCTKPASARDRSHEGNYSLEFLQSFSRFLEIPLKIPEKNQDLVCCDNCFVMGESFRGEYLELENLRLQLEWRVRELFEIMRATAKVHSHVRDFQNQPKTGDDGDDDSNQGYDLIQKLRNEILRGCKKKLKSSNPRVVLEIIPKEIVQIIENFEILLWMMTFIAVFQLSLPNSATNYDKNDCATPTTATIPSFETILKPMDVEVYDCVGEVSETRDQTTARNSSNEPQADTYVQQHGDFGGEEYEELQIETEIMTNQKDSTFSLELISEAIAFNATEAVTVLNQEAVSPVAENCCYICQLTFSTPILLTLHLKSFHHHREAPRSSTEEDSSESDGDEIQHSSPSSPPQNLNKDQEPQSGPSTIIEAPDETRSIPKPYICEWTGCPEKFAERSQLDLHYKKHSIPATFPCKFCKLAFSSSAHLSQHLKIHGERNHFPCNFNGCLRSYSNKHYLKVHKQTHLDQTHFKCGWKSCTRKFATKRGLQLHRKRHTKQTRFQCRPCQLSFASSSSLKLHRGSHHRRVPVEDIPIASTGETVAATAEKTVSPTKSRGPGRPPKKALLKNYKCKFEGGCDKSFASVGALKSHQRIHNEVKSQCRWIGCSLEFGGVEELKRHCLQKHNSKQSPNINHGQQERKTINNHASSESGDSFQATFSQASQPSDHIRAEHVPQGAQSSIANEKESELETVKLCQGNRDDAEFQCVEPGLSETPSTPPEQLDPGMSFATSTQMIPELPTPQLQSGMEVEDNPFFVCAHCHFETGDREELEAHFEIHKPKVADDTTGENTLVAQSTETDPDENVLKG